MPQVPAFLIAMKTNFLDTEKLSLVIKKKKKKDIQQRIAVKRFRKHIYKYFINILELLKGTSSWRMDYGKEDYREDLSVGKSKLGINGSGDSCTFLPSWCVA